MDVGGNRGSDEGVVRVTDSQAAAGSDLRDSSNIFDRVTWLHFGTATFRASKTDVGKVSV